MPLPPSIPPIPLAAPLLLPAPPFALCSRRRWRQLLLRRSCRLLLLHLLPPPDGPRCYCCTVAPAGGARRWCTTLLHQQPALPMVAVDLSLQRDGYCRGNRRVRFESNVPCLVMHFPGFQFWWTRCCSNLEMCCSNFGGRSVATLTQ